MVLALQKMVEVEAVNMVRLCGLVLNLQLELDHIPRTSFTLGFEDIRQSVSPVILCLFLLILCVVHHNFSSHLVLRVFPLQENHLVPRGQCSTALLRPIDPVLRSTSCWSCAAQAPNVRLEDCLNPFDSLIGLTSPAAGVWEQDAYNKRSSCNRIFQKWVGTRLPRTSPPLASRDTI